MGYDINAHCEFHAGTPGNSMEKCRGVKCKVTNLLDAKELIFTPISPNVQNNLIPPHHGATANAIEFDDNHDLVTQVDEVQMLMAVLREHLLQQEVL